MAAHIQWTNELVEEIIFLYNAGHSPYSISREKGLGEDAALKLLKRLGLYKGRQSYITERTYTLDDSFFKTLDSEHKAYWLGFLAADGCIENHRLISLQLTHRDHTHLQAFLDDLACNKPIYVSEKKQKLYSRVCINSSRMVDNLNQHGIVPRKSLTLRYPTIPTTLQSHFVRGYFDGDGMWSRSRSQLVFGFVGSHLFIPSLQNILVEHCEINRTKLLGETTKTFQVHGNRQGKRFYYWLYNNATVWLERKRAYARNHLNLIA